jgi:hypothetical protein
MVLETTLWDPSEYLDSPKAIAAALDDIARAMGINELTGDTDTSI